jgi:transcription-repair coupling factor (superfamily II helicase)
VLQRTLTPFRIRESVRLLKPGLEIGRESLIALLQPAGYARTDTVVDAGEYAVRGSIFDILPSGLDHGLRLDFFGDELETLRLFDPATQRTTGTLPQHLLLPASEALLDEDRSSASAPLSRAVRRQCHHRSALSGGQRWAPPGGHGALAAAARRALVTLFDHLGRRPRGDGGRCQGAIESACRHCRLSTGPHRQRRPPNRAPIARWSRPRSTWARRIRGALAGWPAHTAQPFAEPDSANTVISVSQCPRFRPRPRAGDNPTKPPPST